MKVAGLLWDSFSSLCLASLMLSTISPLGVMGNDATLTAEQYLELAKEHLTRGGLNDALNAYDAAIALEPSNYLSYFRRATTYLTMGKTSSALNDFSTILELKPDFDQVLLQRGKLHLQDGALDKAINDLQKYVANNPSDSSSNELLSQAQKALNDETVGKKMAEEGNLDVAIELFGNVLSTSPHHVDLRMLRAELYEKKGDKEMAVGDLLRASKLRADNTVALMRLSTLQLSIGEISESLKSVKECLKFDPDHKQCKKVYRRLKKLDKNLSKVETMGSSQKWKDVIDIIHDKEGGILSELDDLKVQGNVRKNMYLWTCKAYAGLGTKENGNAIKWCSKTLELDENNNDALIQRAELKMQQEEYEDAMRDYKKAFDNGGDRRAQEGYGRAQRLHRQAGRKNYYKVLGVERTASKREIKKAWRKLAQEWHPDKYIIAHPEATKEQAVKKMSEINEAYEVLNNDELRQRFDNGDDPNDQSNPFGGGGGGFHPFFQQGGFPFQGGQQFGGGGPFQFNFKF